MPVSPSPEPPSRRVAAWLREQIASGAFAPGQQPPSERQLAAQHHVARNTAREAVRLVASQGLVIVEHGRGSFVRTSPSIVRWNAARRWDEQALADQMQEPGGHPRVERHTGTGEPAPAVVSERLHLAPGAPLAEVVERCSIDGRVVRVATDYVAVAAAVGDPVRVRVEVSARVPTPQEVSDLRLPPGVAVLETMRTWLDATQRPVRVQVELLRGDVSLLEVKAPLGSA